MWSISWCSRTCECTFRCSYRNQGPWLMIWHLQTLHGCVSSFVHSCSWLTLYPNSVRAYPSAKAGVEVINPEQDTNIHSHTLNLESPTTNFVDCRRKSKNLEENPHRLGAPLNWGPSCYKATVLSITVLQTCYLLLVFLLGHANCILASL